ncbi:beta-ketoacyl-[acyl-carrier-protein] synthase family protein [Cytobacillus purgationiresistens]|uniref:3-oxoacyl-[acyl-carrier-protein] synthase II n=1 Tax=Cytobacillus purgationiresistens TaxID=863449 RepID=A0ABU0ATL6_9BACI|nr:beta-ketoacyl-[acyl-carrier-protein] synthase family protein [Cytobacillus purgationiresistens]MDQ0273783.1 3-oxoacyl-[acyl-carrier-protein] synthase II [Cytobacillus purgationiresistens]
MGKRIVVTGIGVLSPIGIGHKEFWASLVSGEIGTSEITSFDTSIFKVNRGGEIKGFNPEDYIHSIDSKKVGRTTQLAVAAANMAYEDAGLEHSGYEKENIGVCIGTTMGNTGILELATDAYLENKTELISSELIGHFPNSYISGAIGEELNLEGPCITIPTACAAGNYAITYGRDLIEDGDVEVALVGGSDGLSRACYTTFHRLGAIAPEICQPFDKDRKGMMVSEGAAVIVLEERNRAIARGATIYAELLGCGLSCDAHHPTAPHPQGLGAISAIEKTLIDAGIDKGAISYISAHGTGTKANDVIESIAIRAVFGEAADSIPVSSIKSMLGHTMGAASAIEAATCALAIHNNLIPPTMNFNEHDPECIQNVVPNQSISQKVDYTLSNSFAFGGNISTIIMGAVKDAG